MRIKSQILIPMVILTIVVAAAILASNIYLFSGYVNHTSENNVAFASSTVESTLESYKEHAGTASLYISQNAGIIEAV
jgi:hypothetical protein